jgi:serine/threonine protein kinase
MTCCTFCLYSHNLDDAIFCVKCGKTILLKERYLPIHLIGSGGFGRTFLAEDRHLPSQPKCVIKQLNFSDSNLATFNKAVKLFQQEAVRLHELQHPQIPQLLAHFEQENQLYLVQELIVGKTLAEELQQQGLFTEADIWQLIKNLLPVLDFIHTHKVIHRDIKPANIMRRYTSLAGNEFEFSSSIAETEVLHNHASTMTQGTLESLNHQQQRKRVSVNNNQTKNIRTNSPSGDLVLIDFGVAKQITATALAHTGTTVGSAEYIAPEQMRGKALPASDLYSLGVTCIYLLTGISPFELFDVTRDCWVWQDYLLPENKVSPNLSQILDKLLQNSLPQRYQTAKEVLAAIKLQENPVTAKLTSSKSAQIQNTQSSSTGISYKKLERLLKFKQWKKADQETWEIMRQIVSKVYLSKSDLEHFPSEDLQMIDHLWTKYSEGNFGFSVQIEIYESCGRDYVKFCQTVGWDLRKATSTHDLLFTWPINILIPKGNLPSHPWVGGTKPWEHLNTLSTVLFRQ